MDKGQPDSSHQPLLHREACSSLWGLRAGWGRKEFPSCPPALSSDHNSGFVRSGCQEGAYLQQQPPAAVPVYLQVLPEAEEQGGGHSVLDAEVTWNQARSGFRLRIQAGQRAAGRWVVGRGGVCHKELWQ